MITDYVVELNGISRDSMFSHPTRDTTTSTSTRIPRAEHTESTSRKRNGITGLGLTRLGSALSSPASSSVGREPFLNPRRRSWMTMENYHWTGPDGTGRRRVPCQQRTGTFLLLIHSASQLACLPFLPDDHALYLLLLLPANGYRLPATWRLILILILLLRLRRYCYCFCCFC